MAVSGNLQPLPTSHYLLPATYYSLTGQLPSTSYKLPITRCLPYLPRYLHTHYLITDIRYHLLSATSTRCTLLLPSMMAPVLFRRSVGWSAERPKGLPFHWPLLE